MMVLEQVVSLMRNDAKLAEMLQGNHIYATPSIYLGNSIVYDWIPVSSDKIIGTYKLEVQIITDTMLQGAAIESRLKELLLTFGDEPLTNDILQVWINGGGSLYDEERQKLHKIIYFYILAKE